MPHMHLRRRQLHVLRSDDCRPRFFSGRLSLLTSSHSISPMISGSPISHFISCIISSSRTSYSFHWHHPHRPYPSQRILEPLRSVPNIKQRR